MDGGITNMERRKVRMGIDVGGTHTKAVAIDNATQQIIGKSSVKTTHDDEKGVAAGVVQAFENCLKENNIDPKDVVFVAHSTTQATKMCIRDRSLYRDHRGYIPVAERSARREV